MRGSHSEVLLLEVKLAIAVVQMSAGNGRDALAGNEDSDEIDWIGSSDGYISAWTIR